KMSPHLRCQRQQSTQHLAQRSNVVRTNPLGQLHQLARKYGGVVEHLLHRLHFKVINGRILMHPHHHPHQLLPAERHQHSRPHHRYHSVHRIGKHLIQRHRQRNIAEQSHPSSLTSPTICDSVIPERESIQNKLPDCPSH